MKAKPAKSAKANQAASKPASTAKTIAKPAKAVVKKPAVKAAAKVAAKPKSGPKAVVKPAAKKVSKPLGNSKLAAKKPAVKATPVKAKASAKTPAKTPVKALAKPSAKTSAKPAAKPMPKVAVKAAAKPSPKPARSKAVPVGVVKKAAPAVTPAVVSAAVVPTKPLQSSNGLPPPPPLKPGRRSSSRALAHMPPPAPMVPTHAPDAAKASYSTMTERVIAPPPHVAAKKDPKLANNWKTKTAESLTDDEVKAMPDTEYMNDKQMAFFRFKLSILKQDIHNSAGATTEHLREDTAVVPDPADRATIEEEHALELRTRDRERKLLKKIEQSIARIDSGDYGYCDETGEPIGVGRLIARPTASLSLEAQQRRELKQKMFGD